MRGIREVMFISLNIRVYIVIYSYIFMKCLDMIATHRTHESIILGLSVAHFIKSVFVTTYEKQRYGKQFTLIIRCFTFI